MVSVRFEPANPFFPQKFQQNQFFLNGKSLLLLKGSHSRTFRTLVVHALEHRTFIRMVYCATDGGTEFLTEIPELLDREFTQVFTATPLR